MTNERNDIEMSKNSKNRESGLSICSASSSLPDDSWLQILKLLSFNNVRNLIELADNFAKHSLGRVAKDKTLWKHVKWNGCATKSELRRMVRHLGKHTKTLHIQGHLDSNLNETKKGLYRNKENRPKRKPNPKNHCQTNDIIEINDAFLRSVQLKCVKLESLTLLSCNLDFYSRPFQGNLPKNLHTIVLNKVSFSNLSGIPLNTSSPFFKHQKFLPNLKEVVIKDPIKGWFTNADKNCLRTNKTLSLSLPEKAAYCKQLRGLQFNPIRT